MLWRRQMRDGNISLRRSKLTDGKPFKVKALGVPATHPPWPWAAALGLRINEHPELRFN